MAIYMNAMKQCYLTLREKHARRYGNRDLNISDMSYFAFHTPFSKMVQKSFMALILADIEQNYQQVKAGTSQGRRYPEELMEQLAANQFKNDAKTSSMLLKKYGARW